MKLFCDKLLLIKYLFEICDKINWTPLVQTLKLIHPVVHVISISTQRRQILDLILCATDLNFMTNSEGLFLPHLAWKAKWACAMATIHRVSVHRPSIHPSTFPLNDLFSRTSWADFNYIWQDASLGHRDPNLFKSSQSAHLTGGHLGFWPILGNVFKTLLLRNHLRNRFKTHETSSRERGKPSLFKKTWLTKWFGGHLWWPSFPENDFSKPAEGIRPKFGRYDQGLRAIKGCSREVDPSKNMVP
jgi:hypothetical protein